MANLKPFEGRLITIGINHALIEILVGPSKQTRLWRHIRDDVIKWKHFPRNWPFVRGIHPVNSPHKGQ